MTTMKKNTLILCVILFLMLALTFMSHAHDITDDAIPPVTTITAPRLDQRPSARVLGWLNGRQIANPIHREDKGQPVVPVVSAILPTAEPTIVDMVSQPVDAVPAEPASMDIAMESLPIMPVEPTVFATAIPAAQTFQSSEGLISEVAISETLMVEPPPFTPTPIASGG